MPDDATLLPRTARPAEVLRSALDAVERGHAVAIATVVARRGSSPATPGQKLALAWDAREKVAILAIGTVGGGAVEQSVLRLMKTAASDPAQLPEVHTFKLGPSLGMCCGGQTDVLIEVLRAGAAVLLVGAGHVGLATAKLLGDLGFLVVIADAREQATERGRMAAARAAGVRVVAGEHDDPEVLEALGATPHASAMVVMSHDHQLDQQVIEWGLRQGFDFVGGVGSRAKAERTRQRLIARGLPGPDAARVRMPVGVTIGARRPLEIAVAIAGELVAWRARTEGVVRDHPDSDIAEAAADSARIGVDGVVAPPATEAAGSGDSDPSHARSRGAVGPVIRSQP